VSEVRTAWLNCSSGIAGDMFLGSLLDAGASLDAVNGTLAALGLEGWSLEAQRVARAGITATHAVVTVDDDGHVRPYRVIRELLETSALPARVKERSQAAFAVLAEVEAALHGVDVDDVHFHEVGGHDALIDIVGTMAALEDLGIEQVAVSPIGVGVGTIRTAHGLLPNPAPATVALLKGFEVVGIDEPVELATPTGAALVAALASTSAPVPGMRVTGQGFGAGTRDPEHRANVVGVVLGIRSDPTAEQIAVVETTLDDITGEHLSHALATVVAEGALDAWVTPVTMKKGRSGHVLTVLCAPHEAAAVQRRVHELTGSLGVRVTLTARSVMLREIHAVDVLGHPIRIKVSAVSAKPEFEDVVAVASATGRDLSEIDALARAALDEAGA